MAAAGAPAPDFDSLLGEYQRFRSGYPPELYQRVLAAAPLRPRVLDVGHGTGLAAEGLRDSIAMLVGVDVAPRMLRASPAAAKVQGRAEALPFRDGAFDLVTCAQAFHWFQPGPAFTQFHRVLRPSGAAAVWWKYEAQDDPTAQLADRVVSGLLGRPAPATPLAREAVLPGARESPFGGWEEVRLVHPLRHTVASYVGWQASREVLRQAAGPRRDEVLAALEGALRARHGEEAFEVRQLVRLCLLRKADAAGAPEGSKGRSGLRRPC